MIPKKETMTVEFKSDRKGLSDRLLAEEVVAMANSEGGTIYIGVEDDGTITGAQKEHLDKEGVRAVIANLTFPSVFVQSDIIEENGLPVVKLEVPVSTSIVATSSGKTLQRRLRFDGAPEMKPLYPYEFESRKSYLGQVDPSRVSVFPYRDDLIDESSIAKAKDAIELNENSDKTLLGLENMEFLSSMEAIFLDASGEPRITLAGLLLFGTSDAIKRLCPSASYAFQRLESGKVRQNDETSLNVLDAFEAFERFVETFDFEDEFLYKMRRIGVRYFEKDALREAFANAIAHRDYSILDPVRATYDGAGLTIFNPGRLIRGLSPNGLIVASPRGRNPLLSTSLKRLGLCERTGRGVDRIYASFARYGKRWPRYSLSDENGVTLYLSRSRIDEDFARFVLDLNPRLDPVPLICLSYVRSASEADANEIAAAMSIPKEIVASEMDALLERGAVEEEDGVYRLRGADIKKAPTKIGKEEAFGLVLALAKRQKEGISSNDVQSLLGIDGDKAHYLLKQMVAKGMLRSEGRLKYTKYFPAE